MSNRLLRFIKNRFHLKSTKTILILFPFVFIFALIDLSSRAKTVKLPQDQVESIENLNKLKKVDPLNFLKHPEKFKKFDFHSKTTSVYRDREYNAFDDCENRTNYFGWLNPEKNYHVQQKCGDKIEMWGSYRIENFKATVLRHFLLDFRLGMPQARKQIQSSAQDGYFHDPRYILTGEQFTCFCPEEINRTFTDEQLFPMLRPHFGIPYEGEPLNKYTCSDQWIEKVIADTHEENVMHFTDKTIVISRFADHNPFFVVNLALHAWLMLRNLKWQNETTQVLILDDGCPTCGPSQPTLQLFETLLGPVTIASSTLNGKLTHFDQALFVPVEYHGPLASEADYGKTDCHSSDMIRDFKLEILQKFSISQVNARSTAIKRILFLERNNVKDRKLERRLINQDHIFKLTAMFFKTYFSRQVELVRIDYVNLNFLEQIQATRKADMLMGMHGAGMLHSLWLRENAWVVEIFPKYRFRYTYHNICRFTGCQYAEFRGGTDTESPEDNKHIPPVEWIQFLKDTFLDEL